MANVVVTANPFAPTAFEHRKARTLTRNKWIAFGFCGLLVVPLLLILADIFIKAAPVLSIDYLWDNPVNKGKEGGLWAPLAGTFALVIISLVLVAPVGVLGAIYLNE